MERVDCVVIGAGVIGLACAAELARSGREVLILEKEAQFGQGVSSRSSEVVHAGLYYPKGSLKARLCVAGRRLLYAYCTERGIPHRRTGKLVVATDAAQLPALEALARQAAANDVEGIEHLDRAAARALEPALRCEAALLSPETGIVDSHSLMLNLLGDAEAAGATLVCHCPVNLLTCGNAGWVVETGGEAPMRFEAGLVINAAGLGALPLAHATPGRRAQALPQLQPPFARGNYFSLSGRAPFSHLIYPLPEPGGLGTHLTLDLGGQARFGADVEWSEAEDYRVSRQRLPRFVDAIRRYWPALDETALQPAYVGIRPKLHGPGEAAPDFLIEGPAQHGQPGLYHLLGIESPGLTASLAVARLLCDTCDP